MNKKIIQSTPYGPVVIIWNANRNRAKIVRILLSKPGKTAIERASELYSNATDHSCKEIDSVASNLHRLLSGEAIDFTFDFADLSICGQFQRQVLLAEHAIPRGRVSTYKLIAAHLGVPNGARAVGNALANNPFPIIVPCHRAIRSDRGLGGYQGGLHMKRGLLMKEGIQFDASDRVVCSRFHYQ